MATSESALLRMRATLLVSTSTQKASQICLMPAATRNCFKINQYQGPVAGEVDELSEWFTGCRKLTCLSPQISGKFSLLAR